VFLILPQLDILRTSAVIETILMIKMTIRRIRITSFPCNGVHVSNKKPPPSSADLSLVNSLLWRALQ